MADRRQTRKGKVFVPGLQTLLPLTMAAYLGYQAQKPNAIIPYPKAVYQHCGIRPGSSKFTCEVSEDSTTTSPTVHTYTMKGTPGTGITSYNAQTGCPIGLKNNNTGQCRSNLSRNLSTIQTRKNLQNKKTQARRNITTAVSTESAAKAKAEQCATHYFPSWDCLGSERAYNSAKSATELAKSKYTRLETELAESPNITTSGSLSSKPLTFYTQRNVNLGGRNPIQFADFKFPTYDEYLMLKQFDPSLPDPNKDRSAFETAILTCMNNPKTCAIFNLLVILGIGYGAQEYRYHTVTKRGKKYEELTRRNRRNRNREVRAMQQPQHFLPRGVRPAGQRGRGGGTRKFRKL